MIVIAVCEPFLPPPFPLILIKLNILMYYPKTIDMTKKMTKDA